MSKGKVAAGVVIGATGGAVATKLIDDVVDQSKKDAYNYSHPSSIAVQPTINNSTALPTPH